MRQTTFKYLKTAALLATLASAPAVAFQESKVAPTEEPTATAPLTPQLQLPESKPGLQLSVPDSGKGTEVRIPGLGKLGVLPKLDFGLDILYGATDDRRQLPGAQGNSDELTVRGSIKHKF